MPNGLDFYWDGQGTGSCWQNDHAAGADPIAIPSCPAVGQDRLLADPNKLVLFVTCSNYNLPTQTLPLGCDWFDTPQRPGVVAASVNIESVVPAVQLIAIMVLFAWLTRRTPGLLGVASAAAASVGAVLLLAASIDEYYYLVAPGIAILGVAWLGAARLMKVRELAVLSIVLGVIALLESIDTGVALLPFPVGPVWVRLVLEGIWLVWTGVALVTSARADRRPAPG
jgi:hypothetical protein